MSYEERLRKLILPSLAYRRRRDDMIYTYILATGKVNMNKNDFFKASHLTTRGHKHKIFKDHVTKFPRINTFSNRIVRDWNELTSEIVEAQSTNSFKNKLDKFWDENRYETPS